MTKRELLTFLAIAESTKADFDREHKRMEDDRHNYSPNSRTQLEVSRRRWHKIVRLIKSEVAIAE